MSDGYSTFSLFLVYFPNYTRDLLFDCIQTIAINKNNYDVTMLAIVVL